MRAFLLTLLCMTCVFAAPAQSGRQVEVLDSGWQFHKGAVPTRDALDTVSWTSIRLPHSWNKRDMQTGNAFYEGDGWYQQKLYIPEAAKNKRLFLRFEGVGNVAEVYVNRRLVGTHKGGYTAFCLEITDAIRAGEENLIRVKANNTLRPDVIPINHKLFANYGGIYRPVQLIVTEKLNISTLDHGSMGVYIDQQAVSEQSAHLSVKVKLENHFTHTQAATVRAVLEDADHQMVQAAAIDGQIAPQGVTTMVIPIPVLQPHLWNGRKDPYLYTVRVEVEQDGRLLDAVSQPIGIRSFHLEAGKGFFLNGQPYRLYGVCRHQDWWGQGNALTDSMQRVDMQLIDEIGATAVRFSHYPQADLIYSLCDSMGLMAWAEIPFVNAASGKEGPNAKTQLVEMIRQLYNHPAIFIWGLHNEVYTKHPYGYPARLTHELNDLAKTEDPYRYTVTTNGHGDMQRPMNRMADVQAINRYYGWYEGQMDDLDGWLDGLEKTYPDYAVVLAEYGAGGNVDQHAENAQKPDDVISGSFFPEEYQTRLHVHQWSIIEAHRYLLAAYVWNMFDFCVPGGWNRGGVANRNFKGLVTFDRQTKKDAFYWYKANWSSQPVLHLTGRRMPRRRQKTQQVEAFSNIGQPQLWLNGKMQKQPEQGENTKDWVWPSVRLKAGKNILELKGTANDQPIRDTVVWYLDE